jgi:hypothetical protein
MAAVPTHNFSNHAMALPQSARWTFENLDSLFTNESVRYPTLNLNYSDPNLFSAPKGFAHPCQGQSSNEPAGGQPE